MDFEGDADAALHFTLPLRTSLIVMRYIIYGAGALGAVLGGHFFRYGFDVVLIGRGKHVDKINQDGLRLIMLEETFQLRLSAVSSPKEVNWTGEEAVYMCMKSQDTEGALGDLVATGADTDSVPVICFQNGIANEPIAVRYCGNVYGAMVNIPGIFLEDGVVHNPIVGNAGYVDLGLYPLGLNGTAERLVTDLRKAGYAAFTNENIMGAKAAKMLGNLGNAVSAITDGKGDGESLVNLVREEAVRCLEAAGLPLEDRETMTRRVSAHRGKSPKPYSVRALGSSWQSLARRQGSIEVDFLNGEIVRLGRIYGVSTPYNVLLQRVANEMARNSEEPGKYTAEELIGMG